MIDFKTLKRNLKKDFSNLPSVKVSLLGDSATQFLATSIKGFGVELGYNIDLFEAEYNQVERQLLDSTSDFYRYDAKYTIIFQSTHKLLEKYAKMTFEEQSGMANDRLDFIRSICSLVSSKIIYYNYPEIDDSVFGSYSNKVVASFTYQLRKLNYELMNFSQEFPNFFICDLSALQNKLGRDKMFDANVYVGTDMLLSIDALPYVAARTMDIIASIEGKFKKCLILDLDNTIWGGVVGDEGWENIQVGHGLGIGKAYTELQEWVKKLKNRGIIIAVCSKNDEEKAKEPFEKNPEMVLKLDDISVFIANWENKADNIRTIQRVLNIGFDSMVFLDDNPFERNMVREHIPMVTVPELPEDPSDYLEFLYAQNLFETSSYGNADKNRTKQYQIETQRIAAAKTFTNEVEFLKSLDMLSEVKGFDTFNIPRVAQLSQRSNQFNLRTIRYTEEQVTAMEQNDKFVTFSFTLEDKFGDNGLIAVVIMEKKDAETLFIDTWFMSCRVLKRGMENFTLNTLVDFARQNGFRKIIGEYLPTAKNGMVKDLYPNLGFIPVKDTTENQWVLEVSIYKERESYILTKCNIYINNGTSRDFK